MYLVYVYIWNVQLYESFLDNEMCPGWERLILDVNTCIYLQWWTDEKRDNLHYQCPEEEKNENGGNDYFLTNLKGFDHFQLNLSILLEHLQ